MNIPAASRPRTARQHTHQQPPPQRRANEVQAHQGGPRPFGRLLVVVDVGAPRSRVRGSWTAPLRVGRTVLAAGAMPVSRVGSTGQRDRSAHGVPPRGAVGLVGIGDHDSVDATTGVVHRHGDASEFLFGGRAGGNGEDRGGAGRRVRRGTEACAPPRPGRSSDRRVVTVRHVAEEQVRPGGSRVRRSRWPRGWRPDVTHGGHESGDDAQATRRTPRAADRSPGPARHRRATPPSATADGPARPAMRDCPFGRGTRPRRT